MESLPKEYSLLMTINKYIGEYFAMTVNTKTVRSTDIYEFLKHKDDFRQHFASAKEFNGFMENGFMDTAPIFCRVVIPLFLLVLL